MRKLILTPLAIAALAGGVLAAPAAAGPHPCADGASPDGPVTGVSHEVVHDSGVFEPLPPVDEAYGEAECTVHDTTGL